MLVVPCNLPFSARCTPDVIKGMYVIPPLMRGTLSTDGYDWYPTARANIMGIRIAAQIRIRFRAFAYLVFR